MTESPERKIHSSSLEEYATHVDLRVQTRMGHVRTRAFMWLMVFPPVSYSSIHHHHFPFSVCCDVWRFWARHFDDPVCSVDGVEGEPDPLPEERERGTVSATPVLDRMV